MNRGGVNRSPLEHNAPTIGDGVKHTPLHEFPQIKDAGQLVGDLLVSICDGLNVTDENKKILESLIWPFVAYRSTTKNYYNAQQRGRLIKSLRMSAANIISVSDSNYRQYGFVKYWLGVLMCNTVHDDVLPVKKDWITSPLFRGYCRRVLSKCVHKQRVVDLELIQSLVKGSPKIWLHLPEAAVRDLDLEYVGQLDCYRDEISLGMINSIKESTDKVCIRLIESARFYETNYSATCPSAKACKQRTIKQNGSLGLYKPLRLPEETGGASSFFTAMPSTGVRIKRPLSPPDIARPQVEDVQRKLECAGTLRGIDMILVEHEKHVYQKALEGAYLASRAQDARGFPEANAVRVARVPEAGGKIRYVSCGCGYTYTALRPLQVQLINCWKSQHESSMLQDDLTGEVNRIHKAVRLPFFLSGDYKAATNLEKRQASHVIMRHLDLLGVPLADLGLMSFGTGTVEMPSVKPGGPKSYFTHREGQLMGHVLSFPLLCIVNRAVYQRSIDLWLEFGSGPDRVIKLTDGSSTTAFKLSSVMRVSCKINGDDIFFKCDRDLHKIWVECARDVGFLLSIGKSYVSEHFCMMNSQFYHLKSDEMVRVGYLNLPLVLNTVDPDGEPCTPFELGASLNRMLKDLTIGRCTIKTAIENCEKNLGFSKYNYLGLNRYWFGPLDLGGYGIDRRYAPEGSKPTRDQRMLAAIMRNGSQGGNLITSNSLSPKMLKIFRKYFHPKEVYGPYVPEQGVELFDESPWFPRLLVYNQYGRETPPSNAIVDPITRTLRTFKWDFRLHPMSEESYLSFTPPQRFVTRVPIPPRNTLLMSKMSLDDMAGRNSYRFLSLLAQGDRQPSGVAFGEDPDDSGFFPWSGLTPEEAYGRFLSRLQ